MHSEIETLHAHYMAMTSHTRSSTLRARGTFAVFRVTTSTTMVIGSATVAMYQVSIDRCGWKGEYQTLERSST